MAEVYGAVTDRLLINLARHFPYIQSAGEMKGAFEYQARMLAQMGQVRAETIWILQEMLGDYDDTLKQALEAAILDALKNEEPKLQQAARNGLLALAGAPEVTPNQMQAFQAYYRQSADKLNLVNTVMLESTENAYRATVADITSRIQRTQGILNAGTGEVVTGVSSWNQAMHDAVQKMVQNGLTGFIDHGGHHWTPEAYAAMDIRTTMFNTARAAVWERANDYGADMYQVSSHNGARPLCYPWQGKVISRSDWTGEVDDFYGEKVHVYAQSETSYGEAAGLFGVNCKHYPMTFIPGFSTQKGEPQTPEENAESYALSQEQRALERKLREEKRDLEVMRAQGADEEQIRAQRARVNKASDDIEAFCDEHDMPRRRNREFTPVNATFQDEDTYDPTEFSTNTRDQMREFFGNTPPAENVVENVTPDAQPANVPAETPKAAEHQGPRPMTANESAAVESYVSGDTMYINQVLRERAGEMTAEDRELVRDLDSALNVPIGKRQTLYRSVDAEAVFGRMSGLDFENLRGAVVYGDDSRIARQTAERLIGRAQGATITERGYMSTTKDAEIAAEWGGFTGSEKPIVLRLDVPASAHGRDLEMFEVEGAEQGEVLLARGQRYHVSRIVGENGKIVIHAEILE